MDYGIAGAPQYVEPGLPVKNAMFPAKINDLHATAARFLHSHRNCLVQISFSGLACTYAEDGGVLYSIELGTKPGGNVDLYIVLRNSDASLAVKTVRNIRSLDTTGRVLSVASETGLQKIWSASGCMTRLAARSFFSFGIWQRWGRHDLRRVLFARLKVVKGYRLATASVCVDAFFPCEPV